MYQSEAERQQALSLRLVETSRRAFANEHKDCERKTFRADGSLLKCSSCDAEREELRYHRMLEENEPEIGGTVERTNETQGAPCDRCGSVETVLLNNSTICMHCDDIPRVYDFEFGEAIEHQPGPNWD